MARIIDLKQAERRRDRRRETMLEGRLGGHAISIVDVSFGGLGAAVDFVGQSDWLPEDGEEAKLELLTASGEVHIFDVEIIRSSPIDSHFGARFLRLDDDQYRLVERLMMGRSI